MDEYLKAIRVEHDLARAQAMLTVGAERQLSWALARQAKLSLEKPPSRLDQAIQYAAVKGVPVLTSFLGVWYVLSLGDFEQGRVIPLEAAMATGFSVPI